MDNATRRQLLEQAKQVGYTGSILDVFQNPQVLDQFVQEKQTQQQPQQVQQPQPQIEMPTPPATTPNYKVPQAPQSEAKPLVMSNMEVPIQIRKNGGLKFDLGGPTELERRAKEMGWENNVEGYKESNWGWGPNANPNKNLTYKDDPEWFDNRTIYSGDDRYDAQIRKLVYEGKASYNPATKVMTFLKPDQQSKVDQTTKTLSKDKRAWNEQDKNIVAKVKEDATKMTPEKAKQYIIDNQKDFVKKSALATGILAAPLALPSAGAISATLDAPLVIGGTTVPGVTLGGTIGAAGAGYGLTRIPETGETIKTAFNNPTASNITDAVAATGENTLDFVGVGLMKETMPVLKSGVKTAKQLLEVAKDSKYVQALNPYAIKNINAATAERLPKITDVEEKIQNIGSELGRISNEEYKVQSYLSNKSASSNLSASNALRRRNRYNTVLNKTKGFELENGNVVSTTGEFNPILNAGKGEIIDFKTGQKVQASIELPQSKRTVSLEGDEVKDVTNLQSNATVNPEYSTTVKSNIQHIEEAVPGAKVFGSSTGAGEVNLPHLSHDYDVMISQKNYNAHVKDKLKFVGDTGPAKTHSIGENFGEQGNIDFNIIEETKNGKATGKRATEIFRQFFPDEFYKAEQKALRNKTNIEIPYTPDELIAKVDPRVKTVIDAYESSKPKHVNRIDAYLHFGDPEVVIKAQEQFVKSLVGSKGKIGPQYAENLLSDYNTNLKILDEIEFIGNPEAVAKDAKKMQAALNDFYINKTILNRQVQQINFNEKTINLEAMESALKYWKPEFKGGSGNGWGLNHVQLGDSYHSSILGYKQLGIKHYNTPLENIALIKRQTEETILEPSDIATIKNIVKSHFGEESEVYKATNGLVTSKNLLDLPVYTVEDQQKIQKVYNEITKQLGIKATTSGFQYGNSKYISTLGDFNEEEDILKYASKDRMPEGLKSRFLRNEVFKNTKQEVGNPNLTTKKAFKQFEGYLKAGRENIQQRLSKTEQEIYDNQRSIKELAERIADTKNKGFKQKLLNRQDKLFTEHSNLSKELNDLRRKANDIKSMRQSYAVGAAGVASMPILGLTMYGLVNPEEAAKLQDDLINNLSKYSKSGKRKPKEKNKTSEVEDNKKKYGGKKCYTCNQSKLQVLYNKRNYKK